MNILNSIIDSLPSSFQFYHLGEVRLAESDYAAPSPTLWTPPLHLPASDDRVAVAISFHGEARGTLVLLVDQLLDVSTYSEMGNVIGSRMATTLADRQGIDVLISPPRVLERAQLQSLLRAGQIVSRQYHHQASATVPPIVLEALVISERSPGNA